MDLLPRCKVKHSRVLPLRPRDSTVERRQREALWRERPAEPVDGFSTACDDGLLVASDEDERATPRLPAPDSVLTTMLADIRTVLNARAADAHTRALLAKAESYERVMDRWSVIPPSDAQRGALTDLVQEFRDQVDGEEPPPSSVRLARLPLKSKPPE